MCAICLALGLGSLSTLHILDHARGVFYVLITLGLLFPIYHETVKCDEIKESDRKQPSLLRLVGSGKQLPSARKKKSKNAVPDCETLRLMLHSRSLSTQGNKTDLLKRWTEFVEEAGVCERETVRAGDCRSDPLCG